MAKGSLATHVPSSGAAVLTMHGMQANITREREFILRLSCRDTKGIVHAVSGLLFQAGCNIIDSQQFGDLTGGGATGRFFMRVHFEAPPQLAEIGRAHV